ncbi:MAG TPA: glycosyltransferase [Polyangiaceae bacterium]|nr:glycosyltransferase [Polyangiaceae bacterium]
MRILLQTWGTDGDIRPFISLGAGLVLRGHTVTLAVGSLDDKDYGAMCKAVGVSCIRAPGRSNVDLRRWSTRQYWGARGSLEAVRLLHEQALFPAWGPMSETAERLCATADVAVGHFLAQPLRLAAEKRCLPFASVVFWPGIVPDPMRPPEGAPRLGRIGNSLLWRIVFDQLERTLMGGYRALYRTNGREIPASFTDIWYSPRLNLLACSAGLWPDAGIGAPHRFCGHWPAPSALASEALPAEVESFLSDGEPPVLLTFGSSGQVDPAGSEALLVEIAERSRLRAIVQLGPGSAHRSASRQTCFIGNTNHARLLPRCAATLHHGGAGTAHGVLAAGRPSVVVGFMEEQMSWGRRLVRQGVCAGVFRFRPAKPAHIASALRRAAVDPAMRARAEVLGKSIAAEDGVGSAVRAIEALAASKSEPRSMPLEVG